MTTRRSFLKGAGGMAVGLPFLPSIARTAPAGSDDSPQRLIVLYQPQGMIMEEWLPTGTGSDFELSPILSGLEPIREHVNILSGLDNRVPMMVNHHYGHTGTSKAMWTGLPMGYSLTPEGNLNPNAPEPENIWEMGAGGASVDQIIAQRMGAPTPYESLGLSIGRTDYLQTVASFHTAREELLGLEPDPRVAFDRLFEGFDPGTPSALQRLRAARGSVLDAVAESYASTTMRASAADRIRLEAHAEKIRELELRFSNGAGGGQGCALPQFSLPGNYDPNHSDFDDVGAIAQIENAVMALACDMTRVVSIQYTHGQDNRFPWLGHPFPFDNWEGWHGIFHIVPGGPTGREDPVVRAAMIEVMQWYASNFVHLVQRLAETPDGDGTMLDNTLVVWASEFGDGDGHGSNNIPIVTAGNLCGTVETGRHLAFEDRTTNDLLVSMLNAFGHEETSFGLPEACNGALPGFV